MHYSNRWLSDEKNEKPRAHATLQRDNNSTQQQQLHMHTQLHVKMSEELSKTRDFLTRLSPI